MKTSFIKFKKISWKLTIFYSLIFTVVIILLNVATVYGIRLFLVQQGKAQVENSSGIIEKMILGIGSDKTDIRDSELLSEAQSNSEVNIKIADSNGEVVSDSGNFTINSDSIISFLNITRRIESGEKHFIIRNSQVIRAGRIIAYVQVSRNMAKDYSFLKLLIVFMMIADFLGMLLSIFAGYIMSQRILRPIDRITKTAKDISVSDLSSRIEVGESDDELARLALTFNEMIDRLRLSFERQNQFVSDASHELRTPISVIQGYINLMDRWGKEDKEVLQEAIQAIKDETINMTSLIERLLFLAKGDTNTFRFQKEKIMLNDLVQEVIRESILIAPEHNIIFESEVLVELNADREMIKQLLRALIDNSIKFTSEGGDISVSTYRKNDKVEIQIRDTGVGIPSDEINKVFNRFFRVDKARAKESGGSGLGLSIAKQIVELHNGKIEIESTLGVGTIITIILPCI